MFQRRGKSSSVRLIHADCNYAMRQIAAKSVDLIITDPPWERSALPLYKPLARHAKRVLKPDGNLVVVTGGLYDAKIIQAIEEYLPAHHRFVFVLRGSQLAMHHKGVVVDHRIAYWFRNAKAPLPKRLVHTTFDLYGKDKDHHAWDSRLTCSIT
jgi:23S rRNA G2069 N7-methylase RlmK/C1962 C5-methylase RlmI